MATRNNIVRLADFPRRPDPVVEAKKKLACEDMTDAEYDRLKIAFELAQPTTVAGVRAKFEAVRSALTDLEEGEEFSADGWDILFQMCEDISRALSRFESRAAA